MYSPNSSYGKMFTCFFIHPISFNFIFTIMFLYRSSVSLETTTFFSKPAQYVYFLILAFVSILAATSIFPLFILGGALEYAILTLWSLENAETMVQFYFGITFKAKYLPWVMAGMSFLLNASVPNDSLMGIGYSYLYNYLTKDFVAAGRINYFEAPSILEKFFPASGNTIATSQGYTATAPTTSNQGSSGGFNWGKGNRLGE
ncbi:hypothetical protein DSO57_1009957 [Entomophthora muscae]|uniref:Uncharacterized protein n=1 Tax=Entomophthora muscae TaxID=34485 RepID=A0ACC2UG28_9FUNG|nr:hypothetical protein DSO57_1009957 [Entomophthora muscae]